MIKLDEDIKKNVETAIDRQKTLTAAYVDTEGRPHIAIYGSTHVHGDDELAVWVRNPQGALLKTLPDHPYIAFSYGDIATTTYYVFEGRGRVVTEAATRDRVYNEMHPIERKFDPEKKGVAVIVELDKVTVLSKAGKQLMQR